MKLVKTVFSYFLIILIFTTFNTRALSAANFCEGYADIVEPLLPAVVNISIIAKNNTNGFTQLYFPEGSPFEEFNKLFERFDSLAEEDGDNNPLAKPMPAGSGFIISADGYIVTNYHVIDNAEKVTVNLNDERKLEAKVIGFDNRTDLALLKVSSDTPLPFVKFGDSNANRVGDVIIAIGNPFGLGGTVTSGIISSQSRDISLSSLNIVDNFIQTDAAINQGNSGGPMFNTKGEVIGINFAIVSPTGNNIGIGFAIPSSVARPIIEQLKNTGKVKRGWLGVAVQPTDNISESLGLEPGVGALISNVNSGGAADMAGIQAGDIILKFDGKEITSSKKLPRIVADTPVGKKVDVELMSKNKKKTIQLVVGEIDDKNDKEDKSDTSKIIKSSYGMNLSKLTPEIRQKHNIASNINGVLVTSLDKKSIAAKYGIKRGDIIISANQNLVTTPEDLYKIIDDAKKNHRKSVMLFISRAGGSVFLSLPILNK